MAHESFFHLVGHVLGDFFHYDSKFFRSILPLFTRPGFLTKEYWAGRRMHYINPLRLFFFVTVIMVIVANAYYKKFEKQIKEEKIVRTKTAAVNSEAEKTINEKREKKVIESVNQTFDYMASYLKYISFFLLPIYALVFKLLYRKSKRLYIDHLVYTLHLQSFVYVVISLFLLIPIFLLPAARDWLAKTVILISAIYIVISLAYVYKQSWMKTILKSLLATIYMVFVTIFFIVIVMIINVALLS